MKRSDALKLIANQIDFIEGRFSGMRSNFSELELSRADVILTTMEEAGMEPPKAIFYLNRGNPNYPELYDEKHHMNEWEEE